MPSVIAGFIWHPDIPPIAYAMATTDSPKAMATPRVPTPVVTAPGISPAKTALPHPIKTRIIVPIISDTYLFIAFQITCRINIVNTFCSSECIFPVFSGSHLTATGFRSRVDRTDAYPVPVGLLEHVPTPWPSATIRSSAIPYLPTSIFFTASALCRAIRSLTSTLPSGEA